MKLYLQNIVAGYSVLWVFSLLDEGKGISLYAH
jgi:hypothetical protein